MINFLRADHVHICVPPERLAEAKSFYADVIGLQLIERPKELDGSKGYWFKMGEIQLHIGVEQATGKTRRHTAMQIENIEAVKTYLENQEVPIIEEPYLPGRIRFAFLDPFGNKMELLEIGDY